MTDSARVLLPPSLQFERHGADGEVGVLQLSRAAKRNALNDPTGLGVEAFCLRRAGTLPDVAPGFRAYGARTDPGRRGAQGSRDRGRRGARVGDAYPRDRAEHVLRAAGGAARAVRRRRRFGARAEAHRVAPDGRHDGDRPALGLSHYLPDDPGGGLARALDLATKIAANSPVTNFAVLQALPRIARANTLRSTTMFGTKARYTGASLGYQLATLLGGGFTPTILATLARNGHGDITAVAWFLIAMGVVSTAAILVIREGRHDDLITVQH